MLRSILSCAFAVSLAVCKDETFNILSLDGGGIRGLITAQVVEYLENQTYIYAQEKYCIGKRDIEKISMSELFQMVSGTSTGSLLTTALILPNINKELYGNRSNKFFSQNASEVYIKYGKDVFKSFKSPLWSKILGTVIFTVFGGIIGYCLGKCCFHNAEYEKTMSSFYTYIKEKKSKKKMGDSSAKFS
jgi:hypothetical protein